MNLQRLRRSLGKYFSEPIAGLLAKTHVTPDTLTWIGALIAVAAALLVVFGHLFAAGFVVLFSGLFDLLDGALARKTNSATRFGAVLDSTLDRVGEAVIFIGLLVFFFNNSSLWGIIATGFTLVGSQMVSYIRSRAEAIGVNGEIGVFTRPERVVILSVGLLLSHFNIVLLIALGVMAVLSWITAGQRLFFVWQKTRPNK